MQSFLSDLQNTARAAKLTENGNLCEIPNLSLLSYVLSQASQLYFAIHMIALDKQMKMIQKY